MKKTFTVDIPNELYVEDFSQGKTATFEYDGPDMLKVIVMADGAIMGTVQEDDITVGVAEGITIDVDPNIYPAVAMYLMNRNIEHTYTYEDELNHDNSVYKKMSNPRLNDYYQLKYVIGRNLISDNHLRKGPWEFELIKKDKITQGEIITKKNLDFVKSKLQNVELTSELDSKYDSFIQQAESYLETMANVYPWKYVFITTPVIPKVPIELIRVINEIPSNLG